MAKQVTRNVGVYSEWETFTFESLGTKRDEIAEKWGVKKEDICFDIETEDDYGETRAFLCAKFLSDETPEEKKERLRRAREHREYTAQREKELLRQLQAKYGSEQKGDLECPS